MAVDSFVLYDKAYAKFCILTHICRNVSFGHAVQVSRVFEMCGCRIIHVHIPLWVVHNRLSVLLQNTSNVFTIFSTLFLYHIPVREIKIWGCAYEQCAYSA